MREELAKRSLDGQSVAALAGRQHGVVSRAQLLAAGLSSAAIGRRVERSDLIPLHRGVYAAGHTALTRHGHWLAAVLALGPGAVLSHFSAAALWELRLERGPRIDVTVPSAGRRSRRRVIVVHRSPLAPCEATTHDGVPVTSVVRTIVDLADVLPRRALERAVDEAAFLDLDLSGLAPRPGRRGYRLLTDVLERHSAGSTWTRSRLEERLLALCRVAGLPAPAVNEDAEGYEADFSWPAQRLVVETDDWSSHGGRSAFERDRVRDAALTEAGWRIVRITRRRLAAEPQAVALQLGRLLRG